MKRLLLAAATLSLVSCIPVDDFGPYWDKAGVDKRLAGRWKMVAANPEQTREHGYGIGDIVQFVEKNGAYDLRSEEQIAKGEPPMPAKTLTAGQYQFLALAVEHKGLIFRYNVDTRSLEFCDSMSKGLTEFVEKNYPRATSMKKLRGDMRITVFSEETLAILSTIPDGEAYWNCDHKYERVP
jgi:hypothetical protein